MNVSFGRVAHHVAHTQNVLMILEQAADHRKKHVICNICNAICNAIHTNLRHSQTVHLPSLSVSWRNPSHFSKCSSCRSNLPLWLFVLCWWLSHPQKISPDWAARLPAAAGTHRAQSQWTRALLLHPIPNTLSALLPHNPNSTAPVICTYTSLFQGANPLYSMGLVAEFDWMWCGSLMQ